MDVAILIVSSKAYTGATTETGQAELERLLESYNARVVACDIVPDDRQIIRHKLLTLCESVSPPVILTVGGTGVRPTDWAPEATRDVIDKEIPGIGEAMRWESLKKVRTAMLSRATAGIKGTTLIVNLPGNPKAARENLMVVLPILEHTVNKIGRAGRTVSCGETPS
ncbi:MAG: MogA/MoaB family molybdenum cofactor biosynthesis protein [Nitrospirae bacterium]|nr:MAG: MogA/MoaB family molybdenum cofactor biosynthesis protein [Nitrospirota bacterium]